VSAPSLTAERQALVWHRSMDGAPYARHDVTIEEACARVFFVTCIECDGTGQYRLPDDETVPCVLCKTSGLLPVWL
jgi:hypothetical protein